MRPLCSPDVGTVSAAQREIDFSFTAVFVFKQGDLIEEKMLNLQTKLDPIALRRHQRSFFPTLGSSSAGTSHYELIKRC